MGLKDKRGGRSIALAVSLLVSAGILGYLLYDLNWQLFFAQLGRLEWVYIPLIIFLYWASFWIRALRWRYLLPNRAEPRLQSLYDATILGLLGTSVLPLRAGEFIRPWALSRFEKVSFSAGFASIVTERVFDVLSVLVLLGLCLSQVDSAPSYVIIGAQSLGALAAAIALFMIVSYLKPSFVLETARLVLSKLIQHRLPGVYKKLLEMIEEFVEGVRAISSFKELGIVVFLSLALWFEVALEYQVGLLAMGEHASLWVGMMINVVVALAVAAPSAPGFVGTFQLGCVGALSMIYHYPEEFAVAYSVVLHVIHFPLSILLAVLVLRRVGLNFSDISAHATSDAQSAEG